MRSLILVAASKVHGEVAGVADTEEHQEKTQDWEDELHENSQKNQRKD
jgi:hypothetical protein